MKVTPGTIVELRLGVSVDAAVEHLSIRPVRKLFLDGLTVTRVDVDDETGELIAYVETRYNTDVTVSGEVVELLTSNVDDMAIEEQAPRRPPQPLPKVAVPPPIRGARPMGAAPMSDEERQARFAAEKDDVQVAIKPLNGATGPVMTRKVDPLNDTKEPPTTLPADRVGAVTARGVQGGTATKL